MHDYDMLFTFVMIEFVTVGVFVVLTYLYRYYFYFKDDENINEEQNILEVLRLIVKDNQVMPIPNVEKVLMVIKAIEVVNQEQLSNDAWNQLKAVIMKQQILPIARNYSKKRSWFYKFILLRCYRQYVDIEDEPIIIALIKNKLPVISINAIKAGDILEKENIYRAIIYRISSKEHHFQTININQLHDCYPLREVIHTFLQRQHRDAIHITCYQIIFDILSGDDYFEFAKKDIYSASLNLRIAAIKVLGLSNSAEAFDLLTHLLKDKDWNIRNAAVHGLGKIKDDRIIAPLLLMLADPAWWVRTNAAKILSNHSEEARKQLQLFAGDSMLYSADAEYFLTLYDIKTEGKHRG